MQHGYIITLELTNTALVGILFLFILYNFVLVQLAPYIKKYLGYLFVFTTTTAWLMSFITYNICKLFIS